MISIITKEAPESNSTGSRIKVKTRNSRQIMYDKLVFIWECHNGMKPEDKTVLHASDDDSDDELNNLQLIDVSKRNEIVMSRWRNREWVCQDCGYQTTNNASRHHRKVCKYSSKRYTDEEYDRLTKSRNKWRNQTFECHTCGKTYKNSYKTVHIALCERKHQKMEN